MTKAPPAGLTSDPAVLAHADDRNIGAPAAEPVSKSDPAAKPVGKAAPAHLRGGMQAPGQLQGPCLRFPGPHDWGKGQGHFQKGLR